MLDDLKYIHTKDAADALGAAASQWKQLATTFDLEELEGPFENVVFAGMGGSALWAMMSQTWPGCTVPFEIWSRYDGPSYMSDKTLVIANSYSGTTEETLSGVAAGEAAGAQIVAVARGGTLIDIAKEKGYPYLILPETSQPRFGTFSGFMSLITVLSKAGLTTIDTNAITAASELLQSEVPKWLPEIPTDKNSAKQLALELAGTSPVVYAGQHMFPSAYKWKISFNESAKNVAWANEIPEFSHNEFMGWTSHPVEKPYGVIDLRSSFEHERVNKRFDVTERLLSGRRPHPHTVEAQGNSPLEHMLYLNVFGDFVAIYLALLNNQDPTPVDLVNKFKSALDS